MNPRLVRTLERLHESLTEWSVAWGLSRLARDVDVQFAEELGGDLGQCDLGRHVITLHALLLEPRNGDLLFETLCHEAAHLVAYHRYGTGIESHGPEWQGYMKKAGYQPRAEIREADLGQALSNPSCISNQMKSSDRPT
ncbi:SprT-like domain-containing protein [Verrucomicrobia bacterium]|nr:SprT-like domain-containing protein [Verrucomicrobiota bacterium]